MFATKLCLAFNAFLCINYTGGEWDEELQIKPQRVPVVCWIVGNKNLWGTAEFWWVFIQYCLFATKLYVSFLMCFCALIMQVGNRTKRYKNKNTNSAGCVLCVGSLTIRTHQFGALSNFSEFLYSIILFATKLCLAFNAFLCINYTGGEWDEELQIKPQRVPVVCWIVGNKNLWGTAEFWWVFIQYCLFATKLYVSFLMCFCALIMQVGNRTKRYKNKNTNSVSCVLGR